MKRGDVAAVGPSFQTRSSPEIATRSEPNRRAGEWTAETERDFLDHLSATANARASADAAGVSVSGAWLRRRRMPGFAEAWDEAVADGHARLEMLLMERGTALLGGLDFGGSNGDGAAATDDAARDGTARAAFDPQIAMWLLKRRDQARAGTVARGRAWTRERSIDEVRAEILRKVEAMERARARGLRSAVFPAPDGGDPASLLPGRPTGLTPARATPNRVPSRE